VIRPEAPFILGIDELRKGYFKEPKGYWWAFGVAKHKEDQTALYPAWPLRRDPFIVGFAVS